MPPQQPRASAAPRRPRRVSCGHPHAVSPTASPTAPPGVCVGGASPPPPRRLSELRPRPFDRPTEFGAPSAEQQQQQAGRREWGLAPELPRGRAGSQGPCPLALRAPAAVAPAPAPAAAPEPRPRTAPGGPVPAPTPAPAPGEVVSCLIGEDWAAGRVVPAPAGAEAGDCRVWVVLRRGEAAVPAKAVAPLRYGVRVQGLPAPYDP
eukprot:TRINITY_DN6467_c0_g5_i1.p1 TRINITY_DN6467_c0_g5~~TRINITY_DN6467_c0_g5_i1.p1  ORF type:complete len:230 (+),score=41.10 TRINITY_DN6467_c0_g5_i1:73-690(+)